MLKVLRRAMNNQNQINAAWNQFIVRQLNDLKSDSKASSSIEENPFYNKYADKIKKVNPTPETVKTKSNDLTEEEIEMRKKIEELNAKLEAEKEANEKETKSSESSSIRRTPSYVKSRKLNDIVKLELLEKHSKEEIKEIWCQYFSKKTDCLFACIEKDQYDVQQSNANRYPLFVFPLPVAHPKDATEEEKQKANYQIVLAQFYQNQVYFTPLIMYQQYGENAPPCLTIHHFTELLESKKVVLMEGEFDKQVFTSFEAQCLVNQMQIFYATLSAKRVELLHKFNRNPQTFDYMDIIKEFESLSIKP